MIADKFFDDINPTFFTAQEREGKKDQPTNKNKQEVAIRDLEVSCNLFFTILKNCKVVRAVSREVSLLAMIGSAF